MTYAPFFWLSLQYFIGDSERRRVMAILLHGDAAFSGQVSLITAEMFLKTDRADISLIGNCCGVHGVERYSELHHGWHGATTLFSPLISGSQYAHKLQIQWS